MNLKKTTFDGFEAIELLTAQSRMVIVTGMGPRIAFFGRADGKNLLYWQKDDKGRGDWKLLGGHRVWVARPMADEAEDAYAADNQPCAVTEKPDVLIVTGAAHPLLNIKRGIEIKILNESSFSVTSFITNCGNMLYSGSVWALTCTNPAHNASYAIPLGDSKSSWDVFSLVYPRKWAGHASRVADPQITLTEELLVVRPQGVETKRMLSAPEGLFAMASPGEKATFIKQSPYNPQGRYPLNCNLAFYVGPDNFMVEMEAMGEERTFKPAETHGLTETWTLVDRAMEWKSAAQLLNR